MSVQKDSAAGGGTFALPDGITLPARTIGIPSATFYIIIPLIIHN